MLESVPMKYCTPLFERLSDVKRQRILSTASDEFAALGYRSANINVIAEKCDISVGSLYKYFGTKENLFLSVCDLAAETLRAGLRKIENIEGGFFEKVRVLLALIQKHSREYPGIIHLYNEFTTQGNRELAEKLSYEVEQITAPLYASLIREAKDSGEISLEVDERMAAFCLDNLFMALQFSYATEYYRERMKIYIGDDIFDDDERVLERTLDFIRRALEPRME